jgi:site-specific DNA recombinase
MRAAIYSRKSKFTGTGESTQNQIDLCKEYANNYFNISDFIIYEDEGFSGGNTDRPKYQKMIKAAKNKNFDVLICYRLDRITRNVLDFSKTIEMLQKNNIQFVSIREQFDTSTPMGRAMMYISSVFAQLERETIAERIKDNMQRLALTGRWLGGKTPYGFTSKQLEVVNHEGSMRKLYKLIPVPSEIKIVKQIYTKYLELCSFTKVESYLIQNNIKRNENFFNPSTLRYILRNPVYCIADQLSHQYFMNHGATIASKKRTLCFIINVFKRFITNVFQINEIYS